MARKIKLGDRVTHGVTGYTGIVIGKTEWIYGCIRFGVQSETLKDGKPLEAQWFDEQELGRASKRKAGPPSCGAETG